MQDPAWHARQQGNETLHDVILKVLNARYKLALDNLAIFDDKVGIITNVEDHWVEEGGFKGLLKFDFPRYLGVLKLLLKEALALLDLQALQLHC